MGRRGKTFGTLCAKARHDEQANKQRGAQVNLSKNKGIGGRHETAGKNYGGKRKKKTNDNCKGRSEGEAPRAHSKEGWWLEVVTQRVLSGN